jgi:ribosomal protein S5
MRQLVLVLLMLVVPAVSTAAVETWTNVALVDTQCAPKVMDDPDAHTTKCALQCAKSGFGIITADGSFLTLDEAGNKKAAAALKATKKTEHLRATVTGDRQGDTIKVASLSLDAPVQ